MNFRIAMLVTLVALTLAATGCFDMETEVKVLPDGSGFVTVWIRMPTRTATVGAAAMGSSLARERGAVLSRLDKVFYKRDGVRLVERVVFQEGDHYLLRYRYVFDSPRQLNAFWAQPENREQDVTLQNGVLSFAATGAHCQARFDAALVLPAISFDQVYALAENVLGPQSPEARTALIQEYYKGRFRLRLVVPGRVVATNADQVDTAGNPMWQTRLLDLYQNGLSAKAASRADCGDNAPRAPAPEETPPTPTIPLTEGPKPTIPDVLGVLANLGDLVRMDIDAEVGRKSTLAISYRIDRRVDTAVENLLLAVLGTLPTLFEDWTWQNSRDAKGRLTITIRTRKALRLDKTGSPFLFAGPDGGKMTFRLKFPALTADQTRVPDGVGPVMVQVRVKMPGQIRRSNATLLEGKEARWLLTARDLTGPVTLEAIADD